MATKTELYNEIDRLMIINKKLERENNAMDIKIRCSNPYIHNAIVMANENRVIKTGY